MHVLEYSSIQRTSPAPAPLNAVAEAGERRAAGMSSHDATTYRVGGMIEDYLTYSRGWVVDPDEGHHFFRRRLEEIMTALLHPDRGPGSLSVAGARALLAARVAA
jgi:hypothetical protein